MGILTKKEDRKEFGGYRALPKIANLDVRLQRLMARRVANTLVKRAFKKATAPALNGVATRTTAIEGRVRAITDQATRMGRHG